MSSQAVERYEESLAPDILNERSFNALREQAKVFSNTGLVPKALHDKPDDVLLVMMTAREIGMRQLAAVGGALFPIDGKVGMLAQTMVGLAEAAGHEIWPHEEGDDFCTVAGRRRGSKRVSRVTFTLTQARRMGLLGMWVEKWEKNGDKWKKVDTYVVGDVIDGLDDELLAKAPQWAKKQVESGRLKYRESWKKTPTDMLYNRAAARLCRRRFSDALLGLHPYTPDELGLDDDREVEAELVDDRRATDGQDDDGPEIEDDDDIVDVEVLEDEDDQDVGDGHDDAQVRAAAPPDAAQPSSAGDRDNDGEAAADGPTDPAPNSAGGGDSEDGHGKPAASEATAGDSSAQENSYARAVHILAGELGLADEVVDEILHETVGDVSANAVTRDNYGPVIERMRQAAGLAS